MPDAPWQTGSGEATDDRDKDAVGEGLWRWAPVYDLVFGPVFERGRRAAIAAAERIGGRILEVGVGTGISLPRLFAATTACSASTSPSRCCARRASGSPSSGCTNVEGLAVMDAERLDFPDESFDVVVAQYVVTTVPNPEAALDEFARVLKPGGEIVLLSRVGAEAGLRRTIEHWFQPVGAQARLAHRVPVGALSPLGDAHARHAPDRAPPDAAARAFLADPLRQDRYRRGVDRASAAPDRLRMTNCDCHQHGYESQ